MIILGIETSCDDTSAAMLEAKSGRFFVLSNVTASQVELHSKWGGVVPNLAAREHLKNIIPVIGECLRKSGINHEKIDLVSVTSGPGLIPALLIGTSVAKTLSYAWKKPLIGIHHIEGHIYANFVGKNQKSLPRRQAGKIKNQNLGMGFPALCLVVSGGHTQLVLMKKHLDYKIIGETLDDAAGEAFDKVARILNLGYPGGPAIAAEAEKYRISNFKINSKFKIQNSKFSFPRPMINSNDFNFSFSGLKTAVLYDAKKHKKLLKDAAYNSKICHEFQQAVIDVLIAKTLKAIKKYRPKTVMLAGGVSANHELRNQLGNEIKKYFPNIKYRLPEIKYSVDNAAMIAAAGSWRYSLAKNKKKFQDEWKKLKTDANLKLK